MESQLIFSSYQPTRFHLTWGEWGDTIGQFNWPNDYYRDIDVIFHDSGVTCKWTLGLFTD